jgi:DNA-binding LacI/PurR family transcriptional regulator
MDSTNKPERATIRDVAHRANVSPSTVSATLNGSPAVADSTRLRVLAAVNELRYHADSNARNLRYRRAHSIGLMVPELTNPFFAMLAEGAEWAARERGYTLVLCSTHLESQLEADYVGLFETARIDGLIVNSGMGQPFGQLASDCPLVVVDQRIPGLEAPFVGSDNLGGGRAAARRVTDLGHRRIGIVTGPAGLWTAEQRLAGYREALIAAGIDVAATPTASGDFQLEGGIRAASELLSGDRAVRPTVLLVANDLMAVGCMRYCATNGIRVPEDVSIIGFDDVPLASLWAPTLTTVSQSARRIGDAAGDLLLAQVSGHGSAQVTDRIFPTTVVERQSLTAPGAAPFAKASTVTPTSTPDGNVRIYARTVASRSQGNVTSQYEKEDTVVSNQGSHDEFAWGPDANRETCI